MVHEYFLVLAACNTIVPTRVHLSPSGQLEMQIASAHEEDVGVIEYHGESPDEQALVAAAASYGYTLVERTSSYIIIDLLGDLQRFEVLGIHEFDSVRKCMSVILKCPDNKIKLLVKGADSAVMNIIGGSALGLSNEQYIPSEDKHQAELIDATLSHLDGYAREGLRTLVIAAKDLSFAEFEAWYKQYLVASTSLVDRVGMLRATANMVEDNLLLLGATGIEDKLQEGVPETIALLREAGIKVWVLTGDKQETAISIGFSSMLLTRDMQQVIINESSRDRCREALRAAIVKYGLLGDIKSHTSPKFRINISSSVSFYNDTPIASELECEPTVSSKAKTKQPLALIIDGNSLVHALSQELEEELFVLATSCKVVLCCRVAPLQKAGIVSLIKQKTREMTLAIGDGANDVSMIQTADVGVGLSGQEGQQAVMASDFAMGQFRFLRRLLLVHGHWNYQRLAYMVLYNFYRNCVFVMMLFWYILHTAFSPSTAIFDWNLVFYSLLYTSLPTIAVGILDKDISHTTLLNYPPLYGIGQRGESYNSVLFWATMLDTLWQSLVLFYVPYFTYDATTIDIWSIGSLWIALVVILVNLHLALDIYQWTWITHVAIWGSILVTYACFFLMDSFPEDSFISHYWVIYHMIGTTVYWLDIMLVIILALLPRFCVKVLWHRFWPSDVELAREAELRGRLGRNTHSPVELSIVPDPVSFEAPVLGV
ncbi:hypothetical protein O6H91_Y332300 [Diphasiastrum complanatum]|nr:hypothetical protein O6H91_Y332300 [Diphasiastrum complanatum]